MAVTFNSVTLRGVQTEFVPDPDAQAYLAAVELADGQALELSVRIAVDRFVKGCKADGIWSAMSECCILSGARTLDGALVPLQGLAPTKFNFVSGDYNRKTGLIGNGSSKYLATARLINHTLYNNHVSVYASSLGNGFFWGTTSGSARHDATTVTARNQYGGGGGGTWHQTVSQVGLIGLSRTSQFVLNARANGVSGSASHPNAQPASAQALQIFRGGAASGTAPYSTARFSFYSFGTSLDLALLDARVSTLISDIAT